MVEFLVFNFKNLRLWKAFGYRGLARLSIAGIVDDPVDHV